MEVSGQLHAPTALSKRKEPPVPMYGENERGPKCFQVIWTQIHTLKNDIKVNENVFITDLVWTFIPWMECIFPAREM
jgi:hypothetical protein